MIIFELCKHLIEIKNNIIRYILVTKLYHLGRDTADMISPIKEFDAISMIGFSTEGTIGRVALNK
jgi:hypothetical protein